MKKTTRKLSGPAKDRFFARFFADDPGLAPDARQRLTTRSIATFTSVRVRRAIAPRRAGEPRVTGTPAPRPAFKQPIAPAPAAEPPAPAGEFDPYAFGLVPVFQREGRDGLLQQLASVATVAQLRQMARAQQIGLDVQAKSGDISLPDLREAIVTAVEKRIADRNAAAR